MNAECRFFGARNRKLLTNSPDQEAVKVQHMHLKDQDTNGVLSSSWVLGGTLNTAAFTCNLRRGRNTKCGLCDMMAGPASGTQSCKPHHNFIKSSSSKE